MYTRASSNISRHLLDHSALGSACLSGPARIPPKPIVAGTDGSEESLRAVGWAAREAVLRGAPLPVVAAAEAPPRMISRAGPGEYETVTDVLLGDRDRALAVAVERAAKTAPGLLIDTGQVTSDPANAVTDSGAGALMLVVGSRSAGAFTALLLGSVSRYAASHASVPVVVIRDKTTPGHGFVGVGSATWSTAPRRSPSRSRRRACARPA